MFFKHFVNKNQLTGLSIGGTLVENRLRLKHLRFPPPPVIPISHSKENSS